MKIQRQKKTRTKKLSITNNMFLSSYKKNIKVLKISGIQYECNLKAFKPKLKFPTNQKFLITFAKQN